MNRNVKIVLASVVGVIVLTVGGFLVWFYAIKGDPEEAFGDDEVQERLEPSTTPTDPGAAVTTTVAPVAAGSTAPATTMVGTSTTTAAAAVLTADNIAGTWTVGANSEVGYRVKETLAGLDTEGVGRTESITGTLTIDGTTVTATDLTVDMTTFESNEDRRDNQFNTRIMEVAQFPTATFTLTAPIELGTIPADGSTIQVQATGDLTLHGVTKPVTFELSAQQGNGRIGVQGSTEITFADYDIENPSNGFAETGDTGTLELLLLFDRAA